MIGLLDSFVVNKLIGVEMFFIWMMNFSTCFFPYGRGDFGEEGIRFGGCVDNVGDA